MSPRDQRLRVGDSASVVGSSVAICYGLGSKPHRERASIVGSSTAARPQCSRPPLRAGVRHRAPGKYQIFLRWQALESQRARQYRRLKVAGRTSSSPSKERTGRLEDHRDTFGVANILEGPSQAGKRVRSSRAAGTVRNYGVSRQVVHTNCTLTDIFFRLQERIAREINTSRLKVVPCRR